MTSQLNLLATTRFGQVEYTEEDVIEFLGGLIGFSATAKFILLNPKEGSPFRWLQSIEEAALAFLVTDPGYYVPTYSPELRPSVAKELELDDETPRLVLTTVNIPAGKPEEMTVNLAGPLLVNAITRKGKQIVLEDDAYTTRYRVFHTADRKDDQAAA